MNRWLKGALLAGALVPLTAAAALAQGDEAQDAQDARTIQAQREDSRRFMRHTWENYIRYLPGYETSDPVAAIVYGFQQDPELFARVFGYAIAEARKKVAPDGWEARQLERAEDYVKELFVQAVVSQETDRDRARRAAAVMIDEFDRAATDVGLIGMESDTGIRPGTAPDPFSDMDDTRLFAEHVSDQYMGNVEGYVPGQTFLGICAWCLANPQDYVTVMGWALGQELDGLKKDSPEHRRWLRLEHTLLAGLDDFVDRIATGADAERLKAELRNRFYAAAQGFTDPDAQRILRLSPGERKKYLNPDQLVRTEGDGGTGGAADAGGAAGGGAQPGTGGSQPGEPAGDGLHAQPELSVVLVVDVSGSMSGDKLAEAKAAAKETLAHFLLSPNMPVIGAAAAPVGEVGMPGSRDFISHLFGEAMSGRMQLSSSLIQDNPEMWVQVLGYLLGQQLRHVQNDPGRHRTWLRWENSLHLRIDSLANKSAGDPSGRSAAAAAERERLWNSAQLAIQGWLDPLMAEVTGVKPDSATSAFDAEDSGAGSTHEFGVLPYSGSCDQAFWFSGFSRIYQTLAEGVDGLRSGGGTPMTPGLSQARHVLLTQGRGKSGSIILLSDGQNGCRDSPVEAADRIFRRVFSAQTAGQASLFPVDLRALAALLLQQSAPYPGFQQIDTTAAIPQSRMNTPITVSTVGFRVNDRQQAALDSIAAAGGGVSARAENMAQLAGAFQSAVQTAVTPNPAPTAPSPAAGPAGGGLVGTRRGPGAGMIAVIGLAFLALLLGGTLVAVRSGTITLGRPAYGARASSSPAVRKSGVKIELNLEIAGPDGQRRHVTLRSAPASIGREAGNDLVLTDPEVSRRHARIVVAGGQIGIEDLNSASGLEVNGQTVRRARLDLGASVQLGRTTLRVV